MAQVYRKGSESVTKVAFIGLGTMGAPMARNLAKAGFALRVHDLNAEAVAGLAAEGAAAAGSAAEAAKGAAFVVTMLPNGPQVEEVMLGSGGVAEAMDTGALYIDMSTIAPEVTDRVAATLAARGKAMIDAPVGRQSTNAEDGTLLIMAGGDKASVERAMPLFEVMGSDIVHCGGSGTGSRVKMVNNYMSITINAVTAESLVLAEASGLDIELVRQVLLGTTAGQGHLGTTYPARVLKGALEPGFPLDLADKDLGLALDLAAGLNTPVLTGAVARHYYGIAQTQGHGRSDWSALYKVVRDETLGRG